MDTVDDNGLQPQQTPPPVCAVSFAVVNHHQPPLMVASSFASPALPIMNFNSPFQFTAAPGFPGWSYRHPPPQHQQSPAVYQNGLMGGSWFNIDDSPHQTQFAEYVDFQTQRQQQCHTQRHVMLVENDDSLRNKYEEIFDSNFDDSNVCNFKEDFYEDYEAEVGDEDENENAQQYQLFEEHAFLNASFWNDMDDEPDFCADREHNRQEPTADWPFDFEFDWLDDDQQPDKNRAQTFDRNYTYPSNGLRRMCQQLFGRELETSTILPVIEKQNAGRSATPTDWSLRIDVPSSIPEPPSCRTLTSPATTNNNNDCAIITNNCATYAAASAPRNVSETVCAYVNRVAQAHVKIANTKLTEPFPTRRPVEKDIDVSDIKLRPGSTFPSRRVNDAQPAPFPTDRLEQLAVTSRRNVHTFLQLNAGLLFIPKAQDERAYCIGVSAAGKMLIGLEKQSPPRLFNRDYRTICLKKVTYSEDCDKVWCRLNIFRKQIGMEKSAARCNNVAVYDSFLRLDHYAYFARAPYKWNLDEYLHSDYYGGLATDRETEGLRILRGVANGLAYVHRGNFRLFHGNLKPSNILIASDGSVLLTDYGFGRICCPMWSGAAGHRLCRDPGTGSFDPLCWKAYEFFAGCPTTSSANFFGSSFGSQNLTNSTAGQSAMNSRETPHRQADMFSAALLGYYAVTGGRSHPLIDGQEAYRRTLHYYRQRIDRVADFVNLDAIQDAAARRLLYSMLEMDVKLRPDAKYVAEHPVFWPQHKRYEFLAAVAEIVYAADKTANIQTALFARQLSTKKLVCLPSGKHRTETVEKLMTSTLGNVKFDDVNAVMALKVFYRRKRCMEKVPDDLRNMWNELAVEMYDVAYHSPHAKLRQFVAT